MDTTILEDMGLTGAEVKVYLALLKLGNSTAGPIVEKSKLQNAVVHRALHSLGEKGIITYVLEGKIKSYQPVKPRQLLHIIDDKRKKYENILSKLESLQNSAKKKPEATIYRGIRGIKEMRHYLIEEKNSEYFAYGGTKEQQEMFKDYFWEQLHKKRIQNKIKAKIIFQPSLKYWGERLNKKKLTKVKYTKKEFEPLQETVICGSKVAITIYSENPYGFLIEDNIAANSYKEFFNILWKNTI